MKHSMRQQKKAAFRHLMRAAGIRARIAFAAEFRTVPTRGDARAERAACVMLDTVMGWLGVDVCKRMSNAIGDDAAAIFFASFFDGERWN